MLVKIRIDHAGLVTVFAPTNGLSALIIGALLLLNSCAVMIQDEQFCAPIPGDLGAVCDRFLTSDQQILDEAGWIALQDQWLSNGYATECTSSQTLGDIKIELESLCSKTACTYAQATQVKLAVESLNRMIAIGEKNAKRPRP